MTHLRAYLTETHRKKSGDARYESAVTFPSKENGPNTPPAQATRPGAFTSRSKERSTKFNSPVVVIFDQPTQQLWMIGPETLFPQNLSNDASRNPFVGKPTSRLLQGLMDRLQSSSFPVLRITTARSVSTWHIFNALSCFNVPHCFSACRFRRKGFAPASCDFREITIFVKALYNMNTILQ
ncbi:hypothetical protein M513_04126 [Trichuris suis]|uniref:Uncharacterized protein n=1 Tax=Trichuris suis TaxID=68888 RepID=A0A085MCJ8_9BILA|nr:hypothetical protein M513_04126 [Trichuris suis]